MASSIMLQRHPIVPFVLHIILILKCLFLVSANKPPLSMMTLNTTLKAFPSQTLLSPNGVFEFGFYEENYPTGYTLAIWYAMTFPLKTIVWRADKAMFPAMSLNNNAILLLSQEGDLEVFNGSPVISYWSSNTSKLNVIEARILNTGNLVIINKTGDVVWQSFDSPTDTLLPEQQFKQKDNLTLHSNKINGPWIGTQYILGWSTFNSIYITWESSYSSTENQSYYWNSNNVTTIAERIFSHVVLTKEGKFKAIFENPKSPSDYVLISQSSDAQSSGHLNRLTLDSDGNLRIYSWYIGSSTNWTIVWEAILDKCKISGFCGPFAWCNSGTCFCPEGFPPIDLANMFLGCRRTTSLTCNKTKLTDSMVELQAINYLYGIGDYFLNANVKREECIAKCLSFCLCEAATILQLPTGNVSCLLKKDIIINGYHDEDYITYLRIESNGSKKQSLSNHFILKLIICILGPMVFVLGIITIILSYTCICKKIEVFQLKKLNMKWIAAHGTLVRISFKEIRLITNNFTEEIGKGGYGTVFKGEVGCNKTIKEIVAVKRLDKLNVAEKDFINEVDMIGRIHHTNLVRLLGYCIEKNHMMFIYEYMEYHSLDKILFQNDKPKAFILDWQTRFKIAIQIAKGLAYLHNDVREQRIIHCDVKPENILLDSMLCAKLADFGMSRIINREQSFTMTRQIRGTFGYLAPEWASHQMPISTKTDVYSYGMVLLEIVGGRRNLKTKSSTPMNDYNFDWYFPLWAFSKINIEGNIFEVLDPLLNGFANPVEVERVLRIAFWCINDQPHVRPPMLMVVQMLEGHMSIELPVPQPEFLIEMLTSCTSESEDVSNHKMFKTSVEISEVGEHSGR